MTVGAWGNREELAPCDELRHGPDTATGNTPGANLGVQLDADERMRREPDRWNSECGLHCGVTPWPLLLLR